MKSMRNPRNREAVACMLALGLVALWSHGADAQTLGGEIPGGVYIEAILDAAVAFIRVNVGKVVALMVLLTLAFSLAAGDWQRAGGRALLGLLAIAFIAGSVLWWPFVKGYFSA